MNRFKNGSYISNCTLSKNLIPSVISLDLIFLLHLNKTMGPSIFSFIHSLKKNASPFFIKNDSIYVYEFTYLFNIYSDNKN